MGEDFSNVIGGVRVNNGEENIVFTDGILQIRVAWCDWSYLYQIVLPSGELQWRLVDMNGNVTEINERFSIVDSKLCLPPVNFVAGF